MRDVAHIWQYVHVFQITLKGDFETLFNKCIIHFQTNVLFLLCIKFCPTAFLDFAEHLQFIRFRHS